MVFEQAQRGFKLGTSEAIHGSLLGYKELFLEGQTVRAKRASSIWRRGIRADLGRLAVHERSLFGRLRPDPTLQGSSRSTCSTSSH